jgi:uncharacterized protein
MGWDTIGLLIVAGLAGGTANAVAGGGTLITFPVMLAVGMPPIIANASNAVAVAPGHFIAALADRRKIPPLRGPLLIETAAALVFGAIGALLLAVTPGHVFTQLVPPLIAFATASFAFARHIQAGVARLRKRAAMPGTMTALCALIPAAIYGGYFGAGLGVMLMAVLALTGTDDIRVTTAAKNLLATMVSVSTIAVFIVENVVRWPETLVMLTGALMGGVLGGNLVRVLPANIVRAVVILFGTVMTAIYAVRYWG